MTNTDTYKENIMLQELLDSRKHLRNAYRENAIKIFQEGGSLHIPSTNYETYELHTPRVLYPKGCNITRYLMTIIESEIAAGNVFFKDDISNLEMSVTSNGYVFNIPERHWLSYAYKSYKAKRAINFNASPLDKANNNLCYKFLKNDLELTTSKKVQISYKVNGVEKSSVKPYNIVLSVLNDLFSFFVSPYFNMVRFHEHHSRYGFEDTIPQVAFAYLYVLETNQGNQYGEYKHLPMNLSKEKYFSHLFDNEFECGSDNEKFVKRMYELLDTLKITFVTGDEFNERECLSPKDFK